MIQATDFEEKQIIFIDPKEGEGKFGLKIQNSNLLMTRNDKPENKVRLHAILAIYIIGDLTLTTRFIDQAQKNNISIFFLKRNMGHYGAISSGAEANYLVRQRQYELSRKEELELAKHLVKNKVKNQARLLKEQKSADFKKLLTAIDKAKDNKELLGLEGNYAKKFFKEYFKEINWRRRAPRTREDIPNLLLDIGYTILFNFIESVLRLYGFDIYKGVYHKLFFARKSLVTDLQEPFRCLVDKALLKGYRLGVVNEGDFKFNTKKREFELPWKHSAKYYRLFSEEIMERKIEIFYFIQAFYRHVMLPESNKLKNFNINKDYKNNR